MTSPAVRPFWRDHPGTSLHMQSARCVAIAQARRNAPAAASAYAPAPPWQDAAGVRSVPDAAAGNDPDVFEVALS